MTIVATPTISAADTAFLLRARLGDMRAWGDFLADCIRGRADIGGHTLLPCARLHDRCDRPVYAVADVNIFIDRVLATVPGAGKMPIRPLVLPIDDVRHWRVNRFDKSGAPIAAP